MRGILVFLALASALAGCTTEQAAQIGKSWCRHSPEACTDYDQPRR